MQVYGSRIIRHITTVLLAMIAASASMQTRELSQTISVTFAIDEQFVSCDHLKIQLHVDGRSIEPKYTDRGFAIPTIVDKKATGKSAGKEVDVSVSCGEYTFTFPKLASTWLSPGSWKVGIVHPPYWFDEFRYSGAIEHGTWLSYLDSECNQCDPGAITWISHRTPPASVVKLLRDEQSTASGERARDIAYALAVYNVEYRQNRDYLLGVLNACLSRPKESSEDDVCDHRLLDYVTNLYWRGDRTLLPPLLQMADSRKDVIGEIGTFYARLLDRRTAIAVEGLRGLSIAKQQTICRLAGADDFRINGPELDRVTHQLHGIGGEVADRCLREAKSVAELTMPGCRDDTIQWHKEPSPSSPSPDVTAGDLPAVSQADVPLYPPMARIARIAGTVQVKVTIKDGSVANTELRSSAPPRVPVIRIATPEKIQVG